MGPIKYRGMNTYSFNSNPKFNPFKPGTHQSMLNLTKNKKNMGSQSTIKMKPGTANVQAFKSQNVKPVTLPSMLPSTSVEPGDMS